MAIGFPGIGNGGATIIMSGGGGSGATGGYGSSVFATVSASSQTVTFGTAFANQCSAVIPTLIPPSTTAAFLDLWLTATPTKSGFTVQFSSNIPTSNYIISYLALGS